MPRRPRTSRIWYRSPGSRRDPALGASILPVVLERHVRRQLGQSSIRDYYDQTGEIEADLRADASAAERYECERADLARRHSPR